MYVCMHACIHQPLNDYIKMCLGKSTSNPSISQHVSCRAKVTHPRSCRAKEGPQKSGGPKGIHIHEIIISVCMHADGWMDGCMHACMYVHTHTHIYIYVRRYKKSIGGIENRHCWRH